MQRCCGWDEKLQCFVAKGGDGDVKAVAAEQFVVTSHVIGLKVDFVFGMSCKEFLNTGNVAGLHA